MEAEALSNAPEAEDGEILNDDTEEPYIPLERPHVSSSVNIKPNPVCESDDDNVAVKDSSDSDSSGTMPNFSKKRKKLASTKRAKTTVTKKKNYNIWCSDLQTEMLTNSLVDCNVDQANERVRAVESYNYKLGVNPNTTEKFVNSNTNRYSGKRKHNGDCAIKNNTREKKCDHNKKSTFQLANSRNLLDLAINLESSEEEIAKDIANKLCEEKEELILRALYILGKRTVMSLFEETKEIEASGGMLIMNGTRRRTPGGVFFYLLKTSETIPRDKIHLVFLEDKKSTLMEKKRTAKEIKKMKAAKLKEELSKDDFPTLLSRTELVIKEFKARKLAEESAEVKNPPPSPATDGRDCSSDGEDQKEGNSNVTEDNNSQKAVALPPCKDNLLGKEENVMDVV